MRTDDKALSLLDEIRKDTPASTTILARYSFDLADKINLLLREQGMSQRELARRMSKRPSEINKWLSGTHNFTLETLAKLACVFQRDLISV